jgi:Fe-S cluster assembly protein SufD
METIMENTTFTTLFAPFDRADATPRYRPLRQSARARLQALPLPTARTEDWRFTSVTPIVETPFELPPAPASVDERMLPGLPAPNALRLVFVNGRCVPSLSALENLKDVRIGTLADANLDAAVGGLGQVAAYQDDVFTALNTSFLSDGAFVVIPDGKIVGTPIEILHLAQPSGKPLITQPRTLIVLGRGAQATIVERYLPATGGVYFTNAVTEVVLKEDALLDHVKLQQESLQAYHVALTQVAQARHSNFRTHSLSFGGALVRNEVRVRFDGEHAEATVNGLYVARGQQHVDNFTVIDHAQPNCASHELYKGILNDRAHGVFNGKILVRKDAQKTDAKQTNKVLLLSDAATINTKPQLEIFADDVKCTHGATIGQLDEGQIFYLCSRGIPREAARRLLTFAFANDIVSRINLPAIREQMEALIVQ